MILLESLSERLSTAGLNTLICICVVFAVLIFISLVISLFGFFPKIEAAKAAKKARKEEEKKLAEKAVDNVLGFLTDAPFGIPEFINGIKNLDKEFYLVNKNGKQFFVTVTDEFVETRRLADKIVNDKFDLGNWTFTKCPYKVKPQKP